MANERDEIYEEGMNAYMAGKSMSECPYVFINTQFWATKDYSGFNAMRWKLDAWTDGFLEAERRGKSVP